jgi:hypothetical protein
MIFVQLTAFAAKWSRLGLTDEDLRALEALLLEQPLSGDLIPGGGGLRKVRFGPPSWHRGKRGALRVIYAFVDASRSLYLFTAYGKNEQSGLRPEEKAVFRRVLDQLRKRSNSKEI